MVLTPLSSHCWWFFIIEGSLNQEDVGFGSCWYLHQQSRLCVEPLLNSFEGWKWVEGAAAVGNLSRYLLINSYAIWSDQLLYHLITSYTIWSLAIPSYHQIPSHLQIPSDHQRKWKWTCRSVNWLTHHFQPIIFSVFEYHTHQCSVLNPCSFRFRSVEFKAMGVSRDEEAGRRVGREMDLALWSS